MYYQATDGIYYKNPTICHGIDWFVKCVQDETPVLHVKRIGEFSVEAIRRNAVSGFRAMKWPVKVTGGEVGLEPFPPRWEGLHNCFSFDVEFLGPIPVPKFFEVSIEEPESDWIGWEMKFPARVIYDFWKHDVADERLLRLLFGRTIQPDEFPTMNRVARRLIGPQVKGIARIIKKTPFEEFIRQYGKTLTLVRKK